MKPLYLCLSSAVFAFRGVESPKILSVYEGFSGNEVVNWKEVRKHFPVFKEPVSRDAKRFCTFFQVVSPC